MLSVQYISIPSWIIYIVTRGQSSSAPIVTVTWAGCLLQTIVTCSQQAFGDYAEDLLSQD